LSRDTFFINVSKSRSKQYIVNKTIPHKKEIIKEINNRHQSYFNAKTNLCEKNNIFV